MGEEGNTTGDVDEFWRQLGEKLRVELKRRGYDVEAMSDTEFEELKDRLAKAVRL
jgi:hypothetical protein